MPEADDWSEMDNMFLFPLCWADIGHIEVIDEAVAPTCTETGLTEGSHCLSCGKVIVAQKLVDALDHIWAPSIAIAPTCTESGLTEGLSCAICREILEEQQVLPALGHNYENGVCTNCGDKTFTEGLVFTLINNDTEYEVSGYTGSDADVVIPSTYNGKPCRKCSNA